MGSKEVLAAMVHTAHQRSQDAREMQAKGVGCFTQLVSLPWAHCGVAIAQVQGVILHGTVNRYYLMAANETIEGDSNFNIECLRKVLCDAAADNGGALPGTVYIQADNAGDNKNKHLLF